MIRHRGIRAILRPQPRTMPLATSKTARVTRSMMLGLLGLLGMLGSGLACGRAAEETPNPGLPAVVTPEPEDWRERLGEASVSTLYAVLMQRHQDIRDRIGAHRLTFEATYRLEPEPPSPALPDVDAPVFRDQRVEDSLTLQWAPDDDDGPRFVLSQHNDQGRGRDVILHGGTVYSRLEHRPWMASPLETEAHELWLDDAQRAAAEALAFVAPRASLTAQGEGRFTVSLGEPTDFEAPATPRDAWRDDVEFEAIDGTLALDADSGAWRRIDLDARYVVSATGGRVLRGRFTIHGTVTSQDVTIEPPEHVEPLRDRTRLMVDRERILDGLAAP